MHTHLASSLRGPVAPWRDCWAGAGNEACPPLSPPAQGDDTGAIPRLDDSEIRAELVRRIRQEIAAGTYETPAKLQSALEKMLERLDGDCRF